MSENSPAPRPGEKLPPRTIGPFSAAELADYAEASGDSNPLHLDLAFARGFGFAARPVHGMRLLAGFEPLLRDWRPDLVTIGLSGQFLTPVLEDQTAILSARVAKIETAESRICRGSAADGPYRNRRPGPGRGSPADARALKRLIRPRRSDWRPAPRWRPPPPAPERLSRRSESSSRCPAPSVNMPMIDWPPTVSPQRDTVTSASNCSTQCTNFAVARACSPLRLIIGNSRVIAPSAVGALGGQSQGLVSSNSHFPHRILLAT